MTKVTDTTGKSRNPRRILVTGGAGFIGSHTADFLLQRGDTVVILDNLNTYYNPELKRENVRLLVDKYGAHRVSFVEGDFTEPELLRKVFENRTTKPDAVIHLGARAGVRPSIVEPFLYIKVNIEGTVRIFEQCVKSGVNHVVYASSSSVYGGSKKDTFSETDRDDVRPVSQYAATKKACELMAHTYHHLYQLNVTGLRFFTVYGPRGRPDMAAFKFIDRIANGRSIDRYGDGSSERDWTYVTDIVNGVVRSLDRPMGYQVFNLGNGNPIKLNDFITIAHKEVERALQREVPLKIVQKPDQPGDVPRTSANVSLAKKLLDYEPSVSLKEGLRNTVEWYVQEHQNKFVQKNKKKMLSSDSSNSLMSMVLECKGTEVDRMFEIKRTKSFDQDMKPLFTNNDVIALPVRTLTSTSRRRSCHGLMTWTQSGEAISLEPLSFDVDGEDLNDDDEEEESRDVEEKNEEEEEENKKEEDEKKIFTSFGTTQQWKRTQIRSNNSCNNIKRTYDNASSSFVPILRSSENEIVQWKRVKRSSPSKSMMMLSKSHFYKKGLALSPIMMTHKSPSTKLDSTTNDEIVQWNIRGQSMGRKHTTTTTTSYEVNQHREIADETKSYVERWNRFGGKMKPISTTTTSLTIGTRIYRSESYARQVEKEEQKTPQDLKRLELFLLNAASLADHVVIAVRSSGYGGKILLRQVQSLCRRVVSTHFFSCKIECVGVSMWGKVVPALNTILNIAQRQSSQHLLIASAEVELSADALKLLRDSMDSEHILVSGACFEGHHVFRVNGGMTQLNAMTSPWNTAALWNVKRLGLTGFLNISEKADASGMEEVSVIALHQKIWPNRSGARLVRLLPSQIKWRSVSVDKDGDKRVEYHRTKMRSKLDRADVQIRVLLSDSELDFNKAQVEHIDPFKSNRMLQQHEEEEEECKGGEDSVMLKESRNVVMIRTKA
jgi:UDP-glucuronate 4-epimerase